MFVRSCPCLPACVRACVRACERACVRACLPACMPTCLHTCLPACISPVTCTHWQLWTTNAILIQVSSILWNRDLCLWKKHSKWNSDYICSGRMHQWSPCILDSDDLYSMYRCAVGITFITNIRTYGLYGYANHTKANWLVKICCTFKVGAAWYINELDAQFRKMLEVEYTL